jgi:hypothetical protein
VRTWSARGQSGAIGTAKKSELYARERRAEMVEVFATRRRHVAVAGVASVALAVVLLAHRNPERRRMTMAFGREDKVKPLKAAPQAGTTGYQ